ncbi:Sister chromatid cohesion protein dcc1-like protein [Temnothorax longispinosus]|uniref:Sister chromatid cohesion protein DCC1 n=1 Tax=Temnothorax longispinosus TaxID=300112 RepID=A0A4S2JPC2_9HYME|nr:Sister chromatid cohesion protein dcc1-like protein [Temnothorax longispinosus]
MESADKGNVRTKENVSEILELAAIKESDLNAVTQCLYPMKDHQIDDLILLEVKETKPDLSSLSTLLDSSSFNGLEYESTIDQKALYSWERLQNELQASDYELKQALSDFLIADLDGYLRLISFDIEARSLNFMLDYFGEQSWELDEVDKESTYECLKELIHEPVFDIIFKRYTEVSTKTKDDGSPLYMYNEKKCCAMIAKVLLAASPVTEYKEFMETWSIGIPEKMQVKKEYLYGLALVTYNTSKMQKEIVSCPEADLPNNIHDRLNELFQIKAKWTVEEITPYIMRFTKGAMNVNALLTKYARCSTKNGIKYYGSKHGK